VLHNRDDFADLLAVAGGRLEANPALVEKDYWVTEALRVVASGFFDGAVFKGGTSLSKAWKLIKRFSEDVDLLVRSDANGLDTRGGRDRFMRAIRDRVGEIDGLDFTSTGSRSEQGISRTAVYVYEAAAPVLAGLEAEIILEMGMRGGAHPTEVKEIRSILAEVLGDELDDPSLEPFELQVLDPRRTFVEKLFAINSACVLFEEGRVTALGRRTRHLSDLYYLVDVDNVSAFLGSTEYHEIVSEVDEFGHRFYPRDHRPPEGGTFSGSPFLDPRGELLNALDEEYERARYLYYGERPTLREILERLARYRRRL
jgi:hypothetical protein